MFVLFNILYNAIHLYTLLLVIYALLSWFPGAYHTTLGQWITYLSMPILKPLKKLPLQFAGIDWSVLVAVLLLNGLASLLSSLMYLFL